jgi:hypothetical protein
LTLDLLKSQVARSGWTGSDTISDKGSLKRVSQTGNLEYGDSPSDHDVSEMQRNEAEDQEVHDSGFADIDTVLTRFDLTLFNATISFVTDKGEGHWFPVRGKYDTGSAFNLISWDLLERADLQSKIKQLERHVCAVTLVGKLEFSEHITLEWQPNNSMKSYTTRFLVARQEINAPFDLLLGNDFIQKHDAINENQSFLLLKIKRKTKGTVTDSRFPPFKH